jgi:hypothetical protein
MDEIIESILDFDFSIFLFYVGFAIISMIYYIALVKIFNVNNYDDRVIFYHQLFILFLLSLYFVWPIFAYLSCLYLIIHFLTETIFLLIKNNNEYLFHHVYTILYLGSVFLFTSPLICLLSIPPMLNNVIYHGAKLFDIMDSTKTVRQILFVILRIIYPPIMFMLMMVLTDVHPIMKFVLGFFAFSIVMLMAPKLGTIETNYVLFSNVHPCMSHTAMRFHDGFFACKNFFINDKI